MDRSKYQPFLTDLCAMADALDMMAVKDNDGSARYIYQGVTQLMCDIKQHIKAGEELCTKSGE